MTIIFEEDFETGDFSKWSSQKVTASETIIISSVSPFKGNYHLDAETSGLALGEQSYVQKDFLGLTECFVRFYIKITKNLPVPNTYYNVCTLRSSLVSGGSLAWLHAVADSAGVRWRFSWADSLGSHGVGTGVNIQLDTWYCIEIHLKVGATDGICEIWINGVRVAYTTLINNSTIGLINHLQIGERWSTGPTHGTYIDNVIVADTYIGPELIPVTVTMLDSIGGVTDPPAGAFTIYAGDSITLSAEAASGYSFVKWIINGQETAINPYTMVVVTDVTIQAVFMQTATLTIIVVGNGKTDPTAGVYVYPFGESIIVTAIPQLGAALNHWELDGQIQPLSNNISVAMDKDHTVKAVFSGGEKPFPYILFLIGGLLGLAYLLKPKA